MIAFVREMICWSRQGGLGWRSFRRSRGGAPVHGVWCPHATYHSARRTLQRLLARQSEFTSDFTRVKSARTPRPHRAPTRSHPSRCPSLRPVLHDAPGIGLELSRLGWSALELSCVSIALVLDHRELAPTGMGVARFYTSWSAAPGSRARG